ncbi:SDR family NAD(P)-dependent oxidoreductase [Micromonospora sp. NBC_01739]|uniref:SDR family NAD(P)-dependent oxidoreductase n=1 Tax=Micromonospora sp. NBC_01739 TaxID=2975985 RepID=UPI002E0FEC22|nr:SDR family NAD(P)-dependent oxidoreductase [Micromonospora sp. NBC_01739]
MGKVWFVTGSSRGLGREFVSAALSRGDQVAATARDTSALADLVAEHGTAILPLTLDVTDRAAVVAAVRQAHEHFGRLDVVVNNAGFGLFGTIEEISEADIRAQLETNVLGALWVSQAVLPYLREQGSGHIVQVSSAGGVLAFPALGGYHASKWALEGFSESLSQEVAGFGIKVTIVEPGSYGTDWGGPSASFSAPHPAYDGLRQAMAGFQLRQGSPRAAAQALLTVVDAENPPLRIFFGTQPYQAAQGVYADRLKTWADWSALSAEAEGEPALHGVVA